MVTGYTKFDFHEDSHWDIKKTVNAYNSYKKWFKFLSLIKGIQLLIIYLLCLNKLFTDYEWKNKLRYVRIYFDTPTFDIITKDRAAKFVDMLSAIGGTMGLLTGFSIISGVEILYFAARIFLQIVWKMTSPKKQNM